MENFFDALVERTKLRRLPSNAHELCATGPNLDDRETLWCDLRLLGSLGLGIPTSFANRVPIIVALDHQITYYALPIRQRLKGLQ